MHAFIKAVMCSAAACCTLRGQRNILQPVSQREDAANQLGQRSGPGERAQATGNLSGDLCKLNIDRVLVCRQTFIHTLLNTVITFGNLILLNIIWFM